MFLNSRREMAEFLEMVKAPLEERGFFWEREGQVYLLPCPPADPASPVPADRAVPWFLQEKTV